MVKLSSLLPLISSLQLVISQNTTDPCAKLAGRPVVSYDEAVACNSNFPLDAETKKTHIAIVKNTLNFYAFLDIAKKSPTSQVPSSIDFIAKLNEIEKADIKTEFELHNRLTRLFISAHDGHTSYISACNIAFSYKQPFPLVALRGPSGNLIVKVLDSFVQNPNYVAYWANQKIDIYKYAGKQILLINGQLPMEYIQNYADKSVGISRDPNSRVSLTLARALQDFSKWYVTFGSHTSTTLPPLRSNVTYTFKVGNDEERVTVPYLAVNSNKFKDSASFYNYHCSINPSLKVDTKQIKEDLEKQEVKEVTELKPDQELPLNRGTNGLDTPLVRGLFAQAYLVDNNTGVLTIPSFSPLGLDYFLNETKDSFRAFKKHNVSNLILDFSNNGGGIICLGYWILEVLFPKTYKNFNTDFRITPIFKELSQNSFNKGGFYDPSRWRKPDGSQFNSSQEFLNPRKFNRGGVENSLYTQLFNDYCPNNPYQDLIDEFKSEAPFDSKNIAVMSNGICYSTCTLVTYGLQLNHNVKRTYVVGGDNNPWKPATVASLAGGTVYNLYNLILDVIFADLKDHADSPKWPPYKIAMGYTAREAYANGKDVPLEFTYVPAAKHLAYSQESIINPYPIWETIARDF